jgi:hypothetical protein
VKCLHQPKDEKNKIFKRPISLSTLANLLEVSTNGPNEEAQGNCVFLCQYRIIRSFANQKYPGVSSYKRQSVAV